eukprot:UN04555
MLQSTQHVVNNNSTTINRRVQKLITATQANKKVHSPLRLTLVAAPSAGKGTFAKLLSAHYKIPTISTGELIRAEIQSGSALGQSVKDLISRGVLLDDQLVINLLKQRLSNPDCDNGFILDGFPRTLKQAQELSKITDITCAVEFVLPYPVIIQAATSRRSCAQCKHGYNLANINYQDDKVTIKMTPLLPKVEGVCDNCKTTPIILEQRSDDTIAVVQNRLDTYDKTTRPVLEYYQQQGKVFTHYIQNGKKDWPVLQPKLDAVLLKK